jgi:hypothetical protein
VFGSTCLCESTFSNVKSRYRCSLADESLQHFPRLGGTANITVDILALVKESDNPQC